MIKKTLSALLLLGAVTAYGAGLNPRQAYTRAVNAPEAPAGVASMSVMVEPQVLYTVTDSATAETAAYVIASTSGRGFMVVSADDIAAPLLGYSDDSEFDPADIPANMKAWLDDYARQIAAAKASEKVGALFARANTPDYAAIAPMVTTRWNQDAPYNDLCPEYLGRRSVTGCMATAEAQVLNYHKFPEKGNGVISYRWSKGNVTLSLDLDTVPLMWNKMLDTYTEESPADSKLAVANLMLACGYASAMEYSPSSSGAIISTSAQGLYKFLGCREAAYVAREWYTPDAWDEYIYGLLAKGPVLYCGQSDYGGHAFVCDGYSEKGYFHFNWGWGGKSDGYFLLSALNPGSQGIGGSSAGYNQLQCVISGLHKPGNRNEFVGMVAGDAGVAISSDWDGVLGDTILVTACEETGGFYNFSMDTINVTYGLRFHRNLTGEDTFSACYGIKNRALPSFRGWRNYPVEVPKGLPEGTYNVSPAYISNSTGWREMPDNHNYDTYVLMTVTGDSMKFTRPTPASVKVSDIKLETPLYSGGSYVVSASITGTGDRAFYGNISMLLGQFYDADFGPKYQGGAMLLSAKPGEDSPFTYNGTIANQRLKGDYTLVFINTDTYEIISDPITVTVNPYVAPVYSVTNPVIFNAGAVDPDDFRINFDLNVTAGFFSTALTVAIGTLDAADKFEEISRMTSEQPYVEAGNTLAMTVKGAFAGEAGQSYVARVEIYNASTRRYVALTDYLPFTVGQTSSISTIGTESAAPVMYVNPAGVSSKRPFEGVNIVKMSDGTVSKTVK